MGGHFTPYLILRRAHWAGLNICSIVSKEYVDNKEYSPKALRHQRYMLIVFVLCGTDFHHIPQYMKHYKTALLYVARKEFLGLFKITTLTLCTVIRFMSVVALNLALAPTWSKWNTCWSLNIHNHPRMWPFYLQQVSHLDPRWCKCKFITSWDERGLQCDMCLDLNTESSPVFFYPQKQPIGREGASISNIIAAKIHFTHNFYVIKDFWTVFFELYFLLPCAQPRSHLALARSTRPWLFVCF